MKRSFSFLLAALLAIGSTGLAFAQAYPSKPIRLLIPFASGGITDTIARTIGQKLSENLGQQVVVDSRPGGNTLIGTEIAAKSTPDGYTIILVTSTFVTTPSLLKLPYDPIKDFAPVIQVATTPVVLVVHTGWLGIRRPPAPLWRS